MTALLSWALIVVAVLALLVLIVTEKHSDCVGATGVDVCAPLKQTPEGGM